jgi:signal transduction histidine kinase
MNLRVITRLPWFEVAILLILVAIGWAAWEFNRISVRQSQAQTGDEKTRQSVGADFEDRMKKEFRLTWERHVLNNSNAMQSLQDARDPHQLPGTYRRVAERLQTELPRIQPFLERYSSRTNWRDQVQWQKKSQDLKDWLWSQQLQSEQEGLVAQSQELAAKGTNLLSMDLGTLYRHAERRLTNYMAKGTYISTLARTMGPFQQTNGPASPPPIASSRRTAMVTTNTQTDSTNVRDELTESQTQVQGLLELAGQARLEAAKLDRQPMILPEPLEKIEREFVQKGNEALQFTLLSEVARLQPVFYALLAAGFGLALFLITAIYRRIVDRLNFRLYESNTENKLAHLGHLSAWLAHEIKQPLTAINAWLWTLQRRVKKEMPEHMGTTAIRKEINRLDQIVKDFLRFTQPAAPKPVLVKAEPLLREVLDLLGPQLEEKCIRLSLDSREDVSFYVDPHQLKQVLINLVTNASESIEKEGAITLRVRTENARFNGRLADAVLIEVEDTGSGIPQEVQERLFDPFFSTKEEGTGLGLPIARKIIEAHNGTLEFKTALGEGTTFRIALPMVQELRIRA